MSIASTSPFLARSILSLFFILLATSALSARSADNIITNGGFESASLSPWWVNSWGGQIAASLVQPGRSGAGQSAQVTLVSGDPSRVIFRQDLNLLAGTVYKGSAWLKADGNTAVTLRIRKSSPYYTVWGQQTVQVGTSWTQASFTVSVTEDNDARFEVAPSEIGVKVYVDDIIVARDTQKYQLDTSRTVPASLFGMHVNKGHVVGLWSAIGDVKPGLIRLWDTGTDWIAVEPENNNFNWLRLDLYLNRIKAALPNAQIIYTFGRVPGWANGQLSSSYPPSDLSDWSSFVTELVKRFGSKIDYYEIWNEFDYHGFWAGTPAQLFELHKVVKNVVSTYDPSAKVLLPNVTTNGLHRLDEYLSLGAGAYADGAAIHIYTGSADVEDAFIYPKAVRDLLRQHGLQDMPIFNTEGAIVTSTALTPSAEQRSAVARYFIMSWVAGLENSTWYFWENDVSSGRLPLVSDPDTFVAPTAAAIALRNVREWIVGSRFTDFSYGPDTGIYRVDLISSDGASRSIAWSKAQPAPFALVGRTPSRVSSLDGSINERPDATFRVGSEPVLIEFGNPIAAPTNFRKPD